MKTKKHRAGDRRDGTWVRDLDPLHSFMPYLMPNRVDNEAFITDTIDLTNLDAFLAKKNAVNPESQYKLFHILLAAMIKTVTLRPKMNRFVQGSRTFQRDTLTAAFIVKKQFSETAHEALAFVAFDDDSTLESVHSKVLDEIHSCRNEDQLDNSSASMDFVAKLPCFLIRFVVWVLCRLDSSGRVPYSLIKADPNFSSVFFTNLGSIKLQSAYHHLNNWGTNSVFVSIGECKLRPIFSADGSYEMRNTVNIGLTIDERIADGFYYAGTMRLLKYLLSNPELLELPANTPVELNHSPASI